MNTAIKTKILGENHKKTKFKLDSFEGPLDLLLFLIKKNEVNIYDIPIAEITGQFIEYIAAPDGNNLEDMTEFYLLASTLLYIKSRMLLPVEINLDNEIEDPREELVAKLIDYQKFKKLSELMSKKEEEHEWVIERKNVDRTIPFTSEQKLWEEVSVTDLLKNFSRVMGSISSERILSLYEEVSVNEKLALIYELLDKKNSFLFQDLIRSGGSIMDVICSFLAVLEAAKTMDLQIYQNTMYGEIKIQLIQREKSS